MSAAAVIVAISKFKKRWAHYRNTGGGVFRTSSAGTADVSLAERDRILLSATTGGRSMSTPARQLAATTQNIKKMTLPPNQKPGPTEIIDEIRYLFLERDIRRQSYINLFGFLVYLALYLIVLSFQQNPSGRFDIHRSLSSLLPKDGNEEIRETFESTPVMMQYLESIMKSDLWRDSECGNGVCEAPFETSSYGRFGCSEDCFWDTNVTNVEIHIRHNFESRGEKDVSWWNVCPARACNYDNFVSEDTSCWFSTPQAFATLLGTAVVNLYMPDGDWTFCMIAPTGGVRGEIYFRSVPLEERLASGRSVLGFENSYTPVSDVNDEEVVVTRATEAGTRVTQWDYCLAVKSVCEKSCDRIAACFRWCPSPSMGYANIKTACLAKCSKDPTKVPHPDYFTCRDSKSTAVYNRESVAVLLGIPLATVPTSCGNESLVDMFAASEAACAEECPLRFLGDDLCDDACNTAACSYDHSDCCTLEGPQADDVACCGLFKSASRFDVVQVDFKVDNFEEEATDDLRAQPRERNIGSHNRFRLLWSTNTCTKQHQEAKPYGVDPVFLRSSSLFDPSLDAADFYEEDEFDNRGLGLPFGFFPIKLGRGHHVMGYPVFVDINLSEQRSAALYTYIADSFFFDGFSNTLTLQFATYNGAVGFFGNFRLMFTFRRSGYIDIQYQVDAVKLQPYHSSGDYVRLVIEVFLVLGVVKSLTNEVLDMLYLRRYSGSWTIYFQSAWNYIDITSIGLFIVATVSWIRIVVNCARFSMDLRYDVYEDITSPKHPPHVLQLANDGQGLLTFSSKLDDLNTISDTMTFYTFINFVNVILMLLRSLKLMDFQPRIGVVTRTLWLAASDLLHFFLLLGIIFMSYTVMTFIAFGNRIDQFSDFYRACNTNFELLLGELEVNKVLVQQEGLTLVMAIIFFWTYEMLVFLVLLNFLLAILIDAFTEIAEDARDSASLTAEVGSILADNLRGAAQALHLKWFRQYISDKKMFGYLTRLARSDPRAAKGTSTKSSSMQDIFLSSIEGRTVEDGGWDNAGSSKSLTSTRNHRGGLLCCLHRLMDRHQEPGLVAAVADVLKQEETVTPLEKSLPLGPHHAVGLKELVDALQIVENNAGIFDEAQMLRGNQHAMALAQAVMSRFGRVSREDGTPGSPIKPHPNSTGFGHNAEERVRGHNQKKVVSGKLLSELRTTTARLDRLEKLMLEVAKKLNVDEDLLRSTMTGNGSQGMSEVKKEEGGLDSLPEGTVAAPRSPPRVTFRPEDDMPVSLPMAHVASPLRASPVVRADGFPALTPRAKVEAVQDNGEPHDGASVLSSLSSAGRTSLLDTSSVPHTPPVDSPGREWQMSTAEGKPRIFPLNRDVAADLDSSSEDESVE
eukprot:jgi/Mesvir1/2313/Mv19344-RA.2